MRGNICENMYTGCAIQVLERQAEAEEYVENAYSEARQEGDGRAVIRGRRQAVCTRNPRRTTHERCCIAGSAGRRSVYTPVAGRWQWRGGARACACAQSQPSQPQPGGSRVCQTASPQPCRLISPSSQTNNSARHGSCSVSAGWRRQMNGAGTCSTASPARPMSCDGDRSVVADQQQAGGCRPPTAVFLRRSS